MRNYGSGSRRDGREGKGRFDLISPYALERLAKRLEHGVELYGERNWEMGQPQLDFFDSAMRHMNNYMKGMRDEDHLAAAMWNIHCMIHFEELGTADYQDDPEHWNSNTHDVVSPPLEISYIKGSVDGFSCVVCTMDTDVIDSIGRCADCRNKIDQKSSETLPIDSKAPVTPSKPLLPLPKVFVPNEAKDPLGGRTEPLVIRSCVYSDEPCLEDQDGVSCKLVCKRGYHARQVTVEPTQDIVRQDIERQTLEELPQYD